MAEPLLTYRIALSLLPGINRRAADALSEAGISAADVFTAAESELRGVAAFPVKAASAQARYMALETAKKETDYIGRNGIRAAWYTDAAYPARLADSESAPLMVYFAQDGATDFAGRPSISIVGTRHATAYGVAVVESLVKELSRACPDIVVVSGLAYGIDVAAHQAALRCGVATIGVVAHGLGTMYPAAHRSIASQMTRSGGAVMSEYIHDVKPLRPNFLARNKLIALMGDALVVAESAERGGALSTVRHALRAKRMVFAVPGRLNDTYSMGCNRLIADGEAAMYTSAADIAQALGLELATARPTLAEEPAAPVLTADETAILRVIRENSPADNDTITLATGLQPHVVMATIIGLEMRGFITSTAGNRYQLNLNIDL